MNKELRWEDQVQLYRQTLGALNDLRTTRRALRGSGSEPLPEEVWLEGMARYYSSGSTKEVR